jgi:Na+/H+-translocating membrane pyrophosphatase
LAEEPYGTWSCRLAVLGLTGFFIFFFIFMNGVWTNSEDMTVVLETLAGFSLGAESIALFARVGGWYLPKAADVGADLVGKSKQEYLKMTETQQRLQIT